MNSLIDDGECTSGFSASPLAWKKQQDSWKFEWLLLSPVSAGKKGRGMQFIFLFHVFSFV